jgi:hypothetical protein
MKGGEMHMKKLTKKAMALALTAMFALTLVALPSVSDAATVDLWGGQKSNIAKEIGLGTQDIRVVVGRIINVALGMLGIVAVVIVLIGGFKWMTAGGEQGKVDEARKWISSGIIGLAIILSAYAIAQFVIDSLQTAVR